jgi:hypothetical protein
MKAASWARVPHFQGIAFLITGFLGILLHQDIDTSPAPGRNIARFELPTGGEKPSVLQGDLRDML